MTDFSKYDERARIVVGDSVLIENVKQRHRGQVVLFCEVQVLRIEVVLTQDGKLKPHVVLFVPNGEKEMAITYRELLAVRRDGQWISTKPGRVELDHDARSRTAVGSYSPKAGPSISDVLAEVSKRPANSSDEPY